MALAMERSEYDASSAHRKVGQRGRHHPAESVDDHRGGGKHPV